MAMIEAQENCYKEQEYPSRNGGLESAIYK